MEAAVGVGVEGIDGLCGGACACATCHVYIDRRWAAEVGSAGDDERAMLDGSDLYRPNSRLGCQVRLTEAMDGMVVEVAREAE